MTNSDSAGFVSSQIPKSDEQADHERATALAALLTSDDVVVDVGANRGQFAEQLLAQVRCQIHAIEPTPAAFQDLKLFAGKHATVTAHEIAIASKDGSAELFVQASDLGSSLLEPLPGETSQWLTPAGRISVQTKRLETFIREQDFSSVALVKSDAQGFDGEVVRSAGRYLTPDFIRAIMVEINVHGFYHGQDSFHGILELLTDHGYFLADVFRHYNREGWLWWADALFLPNRPPFSTQAQTHV